MTNVYLRLRDFSELQSGARASEPLRTTAALAIRRTLESAGVELIDENGGGVVCAFESRKR